VIEHDGKDAGLPIILYSFPKVKYELPIACPPVCARVQLSTATCYVPRVTPSVQRLLKLTS